MPKTTILLVAEAPLRRILQHIFRDRPEFEVVGSTGASGSLSRRARKLEPQLIVAAVKPVRGGICRMAASIRRVSPLSRLILICPMEDLLPLARKCGADACLTGEKLATQLLRTARSLAGRPRVNAKENLVEGCDSKVPTPAGDVAKLACAGSCTAAGHRGGASG